MAQATFRAVAPAISTDYEEARELIQSGDIISFFSSHEEHFLHRFTTEPILFFTGSYIYHTGIAIWAYVGGAPRLMVCEAVGVGRRLVNLSKFADRKMEVHHAPECVDRAKVEEYMLDGIGEGYAFGTLITIGLREYFNLDVKPTTNAKRVCSQVAADAWNYGGMNFESSVMSPGKLRNVLIDKGVPPSIVINEGASAGLKSFRA